MSKSSNRPRYCSRGTAKYTTNKVRQNRIAASAVINSRSSSCHTLPAPTPIRQEKLFVENSHSPNSITCTKTAYQRANVSVPVAVKPFSFVGATTTFCNRDPVIKDIRCTGSNNRVCYFTICQEICVEVPIHFGADASIGLPSVDCLPVTVNKPC